MERTRSATLPRLLGRDEWDSRLSHPVLEGKLNANHVRARINHSRAMGFQPELVLPDCSVGLLGQEDEVPTDSASETDLLLTDCSNDSDTGAEDTSFVTADAEVDAGSA